MKIGYNNHCKFCSIQVKINLLELLTNASLIRIHHDVKINTNRVKVENVDTLNVERKKNRLDPPANIFF